MRNNLRLYHKLFGQIRHWLPSERVTRQRNLALLVVGLYLAQSVHLTKIASKLHVPAKKLSLANRLRRFLRNAAVNIQAYYEPLLLPLLKAVAGKDVLLIIDTTKVGPWHRALVVTLAYRRRALPLAWSVHEGTRGNVAVTIQLALLKRVYQLLPLGTAVTLVADSGFDSPDFLRWLRAHGWHFVVRQRSNVTVRPLNQQQWCALGSIAIQPGETRVLGWSWLAKSSPFGPVWVVLHWKKGEDDPWLLASDVSERRTVLRLYRKRAWIEAMYGDMKTRGFDLELTRLAEPQRIERLLLGVAIAYLWLVALGSWVVKNGCRRLLDRPDRRDLSYFRLGRDWLAERFRQGLSVHFRFLPYYL